MGKWKWTKEGEQKIVQQKHLPVSFVFKHYLEVYANDGDVDGMKRLIRFAKQYEICDERQTKEIWWKGIRIASHAKHNNTFLPFAFAPIRIYNLSMPSSTYS